MIRPSQFRHFRYGSKVPQVVAGREREALDYIAGRLYDTGGIAPSCAEIQKALKLTGKSSVYRLLRVLEQQGKIRRIPKKARALELTPQAKSEYGLVHLVAYPRAKYFKAVRAHEGADVTLEEIAPWPPSPPRTPSQEPTPTTS